MNILQAIDHPELFQPFLGANASWKNWRTALRAVYGLPIVTALSRTLVEKCSGRSVKGLPKSGFGTSLFITGRRSGKSRIAALIGAFEAITGKTLAKGEKGVVAICSPTVKQSRIVFGYLQAIFEAPALADTVVTATAQCFELDSGTRIEMLSGDFRTIRGYTLLAAIVDELAFFGHDADAKIRSDTELIRAIKPGLATTGGRLVAITSPYAKKGWVYEQWMKNYANDSGPTLVWNAPSRTMNPTLPQKVVDDAMADDLQAAKSEYGGEFRDDVSAFVDRAMVEAVVPRGRKSLLPRDGVRYFAFADLSGGRGDDAALAIGHKENRKVIVDHLVRHRPPFNPQSVVADMAHVLRPFGVRTVTGDAYAGEWPVEAFRQHGVTYAKAERNKSALYLELLPIICSREIELLDDPTLINQLAALERRSRSGGKDIIDHPPGSGHDDVANAVAGLASVTGSRLLVVGGLDVLNQY